MAQRKISAILAVAVLNIFFAGCATPSDELSVKMLSPKQRVYVGRIHINFGDQKPGDTKCEVYINKDLMPAFKLAKDRYFLYKTDRDEPLISEITCYHQPNRYVAAWHHQDSGLKPLYRPEDPKEAVYFGDLTLN